MASFGLLIHALKTMVTQGTSLQDTTDCCPERADRDSLTRSTVSEPFQCSLLIERCFTYCVVTGS